MMEPVRLDELTLLAAGREAEIYAIDAARVLRLAFSGSQREDVEREALVLEAARDAGAPVAGVHEVVGVAGRPGLVLDRLGGPDLLATLERRPWLVWSAATTLGRIHARLHQVPAPAGLPTVRDLLRRQLQSPLVPAGVRDRALHRLAALPDGETLCHCDLHPANVLRGGNGFVMIDCGHASAGDPASDVARTHLLLRHSALPEGTGAVMRALTTVGRGIMVSGYMYSYRRAADVRTTGLARWTSVHAAARLAEGIEAERPTMLALAEKD